LTYMHTYGDEKYKDYACILAVLAQVSIDSCKRSFDIDINEEIAKIRKELDIQTNQLPEFWKATSLRGIRKQFKNYELQQEQIQKVSNKINPELHCPMNMVYQIKIPRINENVTLKGMRDFFVKIPCNEDIKLSRRIESLINKYSLELYSDRTTGQLQDSDNYILYREDFDELVEEIRQSVVPSKYISLFSWLVDRAFVITPPIIKNRNKLAKGLSKNRPLLLKCLYAANPEALLKCFSKNVYSIQK